MKPGHALGIWWLPSDLEEDGFTALVKVDQTGLVELEFQSDDVTVDDNYYPVILGTARGHLYSCLGVRSRGMDMVLARAISRIDRYHVYALLQGIHVDQPEQRFPRVAFMLEGLQYWTRLSGTTQTYTQFQATGKTTYEVHIDPPDPLCFEADDLSVSFAPAGGMKNDPYRTEVTDDTRVVVTSSRSRTLDEWRVDVIEPLRRFVQFAVHASARIHSVAVSSADQDLEERNASEAPWHTVNTGWISPTPLAIGPYEPRDHLFDAPQVQLTHGGTLQWWFDFYRRSQMSLEAMLDADAPGQLWATRFLATTRMMEALREPDALLTDTEVEQLVAIVRDQVATEHRNVVGDKLQSLRTKGFRSIVKNLINAYGATLWSFLESGKARGAIVDKVVDTRNSAAHHSTRSPKAVSGLELKYLTQLCRSLVNVEILLTLGFEQAGVVERVKNTKAYNDGRVMQNFLEG